MRDRPFASSVVLAHQWLVADRGAEVVLRELLNLFPTAPVACLVKDPNFNPAWLQGRKIIQSPLGMIPTGYRYYQQMLPLHPFLVRRIRLPAACSLLLSSDAAMIKGVPVPRGARHVCYCHSPPRYLWDQRVHYRRDGGSVAALRNLAFSSAVHLCRRFDRKSGENVSKFIANSKFVALRILGVYGKDAEVIYPPVAVDDFIPSTTDRGYYLVVSHLVPYKRIDVAIAACRRAGVRLVVVGGGPELERLKRLGDGSVEFRGRVSRAEVVEAITNCRAFLYPQVEDFGISAVEAQAAGKSVIAFRAGGALETITDGVTGTFFSDQTPDSMAEAILSFEQWNAKLASGERAARSASCAANALRFGPERFRKLLRAALGPDFSPPVA